MTLRSVLLVLVGLLGAAPMCAQAPSAPDGDLLKAREAVWRAWFADDEPKLLQLVPNDSIVISAGDKEWKHQAEILAAARDFHAKGGRLLTLDFSHTEVQHFGDVAITYSNYSFDIEVAGKKSHTAGRAMEVFVKRNGRWTNPGWHTDEEQ